MIAGLFVTFVASSWAVAQALPTTPREYEQYALEHHRGLWAQRDRWEGSQREAEAAKARWPQPMIGYDAEIGTPWSQSGVTHMAMVSQTIPWPGVLDQMAEPARRRGAVEDARFDGLAQQILYDVRSILIELARIEAVEALVEEQRALYQEAIRIVEATAGAGRGDYGDILRLTTASERLADRLDVLQSQQEQQLSALRALLDLDPGVALSFVFEADEHPLHVSDSPVDREVFLGAMSEHHPELAVLRARSAEAESMGRAATSRRKPWPTVKLGYGNMPAMSGNGREDVFLVGFSVPLPIFARQYELEADVFALQTRALASEQQALERRLSAEISAALLRIDESTRRVLRYRSELMPLATDVSERMLYEMELGRRSVTDYLLAIQEQLDLAMGVIELEATVARERARLNLLTGGAFDVITIETLGGRR